MECIDFARPGNLVGTMCKNALLTDLHREYLVKLSSPDGQSTSFSGNSRFDRNSYTRSRETVPIETFYKYVYSLSLV